MVDNLLKASALLLLVCACSSKSFCQDADKNLRSLYDQLDSLFSEESIPENLFELADSLLALEHVKVSALNLRVGYVSQIVSAGRTMGFNQYGISPAVTYFHHSGFQGGITGYYSNEFDPAYYLTDVNVGYSHAFRKLTCQVNFDYYLYNDTIETEPVFNKSLQGSLNYGLKHLNTGIDYSFLYGNSSAHRITAHANAVFKLRLNSIIEAITFMPGAALQWGNADVYYWRQPRTALTDLYNIIRSNDFPRLDRGDYWKLTYLLESDRRNAATYFLRQRDYTNDEISELFSEYYNGSAIGQNEFGLMNFSLSFPVIVRAKRFSLLVNYTYNKPQRLPGETYEYPSNGYFSTSLSYLVTRVKK